MSPDSPERAARKNIDRLLTAAGWTVQDYRDRNVFAGRGIAVREFPLSRGHGFADYLLYVDEKAVGIVEAKAEGATLTGVEPQSAKYADGVPRQVPAPVRPLPFLYQSTGVETRFTNGLDPEPRSRRVFSFHRPETLAQWVAGVAPVRMVAAPGGSAGTVVTGNRAPYGVGSANLRAEVRRMPPLPERGLWPAQYRAVANLERSLGDNWPRSLIQMATGSGKTYTAVTSIYRLIKHGGARRVLFLVDRGNLGKQALREFQGYVTPDDGRTFTELYNVQHLTSNVVDPVARVCISTVQRLYSILRGEPELAEERDEIPLATLASLLKEPPPVVYNPGLPVEFFDVVFVDECHRSIYTLWRQVLEYFDAFLVGLTATPAKQTFAFFDRNLVMEYGHAQAVADEVNVDYDVFRIRTRITEQGSVIEAGEWVDRRDRATRQQRQERLDDDLEYGAGEVDRSVVVPDQIRTVVRTFRERLFTEIFPGRTEVPKTLIFAKDDAHAEEIVDTVRKEFGKGNDFAQKITYRTTGVAPEELIKAFRNSYNPRVAVTVDMIATGTDIKPVEAVVFMRDVKSRVLFEQMKGRGVRIIDSDDLKAVTPDAQAKTRFVVVDCVGVTEREDFSDTSSLDRKPSVPLRSVLDLVRSGSADPEVVSTLASRLARLDLTLRPEEKAQVREATGGVSLQQITAGLVRALDADEQARAAREAFGIPAGEEPGEAEVAAAGERLLAEAVRPVAGNPALVQLLLDLKKAREQTIDKASLDEVLQAGYDSAARDRARELTQSFERFLEEHRDEIAALQLLYGSNGRRLTHDEARELVAAISKPPRRWTPDDLWAAYEALDAAHVRRASKPALLSNVVRLVRFAMHRVPELVPHPEVARERFASWMAEQEARGRSFTVEQREWLEAIRDHVAANLEITREDFEYSPFAQKGGFPGAYRAFGAELRTIMDELTEVLAA
jgi:type I restriction enzyme R subunit